MQTKNLYRTLFLIYILPAITYLLVISESKLIPELKEHIGLIYAIIFILIILIYVWVLFRYWKKPLLKRSKKWIITFISIVVLSAHYLLFVFIEVELNLSFESSVTVLTRNFHHNKIYIRRSLGFFSIPISTEIGYSKSFSPFYNVYFKTHNNIEFIKEDADKLIFEEFEYVRDTTSSISRADRQMIRIVNATIQINSKDLK